ncbi:tetratricopeptide repeat protein 27-like protein [Hibiscus syriacus]|uniref:glutathione transferase n=1 Tax=Hibiscus syriacus TaxID=106335 RepID=A0A6A3CDP1_HIBSY|nr:tetratricopeptide repeat protein 27-like protein [Hibiscus syriacus]
MSKAELVILDHWVSPFCMRVKIALNEKGLQYEARAEDLVGSKSELLLNSNPIYKKVPVFLHDGKPLCESTIIVNYIEETGLPLRYSRRVREVAVEAKTEFIEILKELEGALGDKDYFNGATFGFVDIIAIPLTCWFFAVEKIGGFNVADLCPKFYGWMKRCLQGRAWPK